jgi:hypothetical protein
MTEVICVGQSLLVAAPFSPSISPSRLDTAPMRHSLGPRGRELRRRAHRHAGSLRVDHVKDRPSPQLAATSPSSEVRSDGHRSDRRPLLSLSLLRLCSRQKRSGYEEPAASIPCQEFGAVARRAPTVSQRPALVSPLECRSVNLLPRFSFSSSNSRVLLLLLDAGLRSRRFLALRFALEARPSGFPPRFLPPIRARKPSSSFVDSDSVRGPSSLSGPPRASSRSSLPSSVPLGARDQEFQS